MNSLKFKLFKLFKKRNEQITNEKIKVSLKTKGLTETVKHLDLKKEPTSLQAVYEFSDEDQFWITNMAYREAAIARGDEFVPDEGKSAYIPISIRMLKTISDILFIDWQYDPRYKSAREYAIAHPEWEDLREKYRSLYLIAEQCKAYASYESWYSEYSHRWKDQGMTYMELCEYNRQYMYLWVEEKPVSEYIKDIKKYYKDYKRLNDDLEREEASRK